MALISSVKIFFWISLMYRRSTSFGVLSSVCGVVWSLLSGCATIDTLSVQPKAAAVNDGWSDYRNNAILLNIIRGSELEPANFVAFASYTGTAAHSAGLAGQAALPATGAPSGTVGPLTLGGNAGNTLGLVDLETAEFYSAILNPIDANELSLLLRNNIDNRELVFYLFFEAFRVTLPNGAVYDYRNNPDDDGWTDENTKIHVDHSSICADLAKNDDIYIEDDPSDFSPPFGTSPSGQVWTGIHVNDCSFHKFRELIHQALRHGLTLQAVEIENPASRQGVKDAAKKIAISQFCYDPGLANRFNVGGVEALPAACGKALPAAKQSFRFARNAHGAREVVVIKGIEPVLRSPLGVFNYLGALYRSRVGQSVRIDTRGLMGSDRPILNVLVGSDDCFASAYKSGVQYCVPANGSYNTKQAFSILTADIALHTKRTDLPPPSTLLIAP